ncbi:putative transcriptional regulator [Saccharothrix ecbatanensis]|uniref:Putative transcriptional regulator n=1 Tax=Saccharothrix ecbatanensis TaxID=1105145 RepID=A0A7W9M6F2_9PSEU|nr:helix-turn-helix domain-containing protein [Saccharothrix ecbatanensis]MBB5808874.1 putative transcriptional regulator [Saccharothrix ecbatanensis]
MSTNTNTSPTQQGVPNPTKPRTEAEEKLWQALLDNPGSTAATLSTAAGIGKSTAPKILTRWEKEGLVARIAGNTDGGSRPADRWSISTDNECSDKDRRADEGPTVDRTAHDQSFVDADVPVDSRPTATVEAQADTQSKGERLAPGALRGMVEDYLREHSGQDFSPNAVGKALNRSAGAVHNALEKLVVSGYAVRTSDKPKKYTLAPAAEDSTASG